METIKTVLETLHNMKFYPEVLLLASGLYYICRWHLDWGPKRSQWVPIISAFVGIFGYLWPKTAQDVINILVIGGMHAFIAIGVYSYAEKRGWVDRVGEMIEKKFFPPKDPPVPPAGTTPEIRP